MPSILFQMTNIINIINSIYPLDEKHLQLLLKEMRQVSFPEKHLLFRAGQICPTAYFIEKGVVRGYYEDKDKEVTLCFGMEGDVILSYNSYINNTPGYENMMLLEDSILYAFETDALQSLFNTHAALANWGRKLAELELIKTEKRFMDMLSRSAAERYNELMQQMPSLLQRVQLGYIASYLGITQVSLSRIRAKYSHSNG